MQNWKKLAGWLKSCVTSADSQGGVLIGAVVAMVVMSALGSGMIAFTSSSFMHEVRAKYGEQAYYNAESGYRYSISQLTRNDSSSVVSQLEDAGQINIPGREGSFKLVLLEVDGEDRSVDGNHSIDKGGTISLSPDADSDLAEKYGLFKHAGSIYRYQIYSDNELQGVFGDSIQRKVEGNDTVEDGEDIFLKTGREITHNNGSFWFETNRYEYEEYIADEENGIYKLTGITAVDPDNNDFELVFSDGQVLNILPKWPLEVSDGDVLSFNPTIKIESTGTYPGSGLFSVDRKVTYWWPESGGGGVPEDPVAPAGEDYEVADPKKPHWFTTNKISVIDTKTYYNPTGGVYDRTDLRVIGHHEITDSEGKQVKYHYIPFKHNAAGFDIHQVWQDNNNFLSYDGQVKVGTGPNLDYGALGIMFRAVEKKHESTVHYDGYGLSYMRYAENIEDYIPESVKPPGEAGNVLLVLWKQTWNESESPPEWQWLAYKQLSDDVSSFDEYIAAPQYAHDGAFVHDDTTLMLRVIEYASDGVRKNRIQAFIGDPGWFVDQQDRSQDTFAYNVENDRYGYHLTHAPEESEIFFKWPSIPDISSTHWNPDENDWFTALEWDEVNEGTNIINDTETKKSIVEDSSFNTSDYSNNMVKEPEIVLHTFGNTIDSYETSGGSPVHFTDFGIRMLKGTPSTPGEPWIGPIQE